MNKMVSLLIVVCAMTISAAPMTFYMMGSKGWIGQQIMALLKEEGHVVYEAKSRLEQRESIIKELDALEGRGVTINSIINTAGVTGVPNVDWCEDHKQETIRANIIGALNLADISYMRGIHMINMGTGCIYEYDAQHPMHSGKGFTEDENPNFHGSFYSHTKCMLDELLTYYPNVLNLRLRMPISSDFHPRSFVTKITRYAKVVNVPNSMSVLDDLLPLISRMAERRLTGTYNFVNPGVISHNEILDLYTKYVNPQFRYVNFSIEEQNTVLKARRSNNELDAAKLLKEFPEIRPISESIVAVFEKMHKRKAQE